MCTFKTLGVMAAASIGLFALASCGSSSNATTTTQNEPTPVRLEAVAHTSAGLPIRAVGRLEAKEELGLSFKIGGIIDRVYVDEGERVHKGQRLASLNLTETDAAVSQAQNNFDKAERDWNRYQRLFADSLITLEQMQNAATARDVAKAALEAARFNREHAEIIAPSEGRISKRLFDHNELVAAGSPVLVLSGYDRGWVVRVNLADRDLVRVTRDDSATIEFDALPGEHLQGRVSEIGAAPNPANGTYEIEITISSSVQLVSGLIAKVSIQTPMKKEFAVVPVEALVTADGQHGFVFVPSESQQRAAKVPVTIAYLDGSQVVLSDGLGSHQQVITAGATKLSDGSPVTVVK